MAAKLYHAYIALSRVFAEIFQKIFLHTTPTIPKLGLLLHFIAWDKSRAILNCRPFYFCAENDFESDFEIESENEFKFKIGFESDFESENDFMFHVTRKRAKGET